MGLLDSIGNQGYQTEPVCGANNQVPYYLNWEFFDRKTIGMFHKFPAYALLKTRASSTPALKPAHFCAGNLLLRRQVPSFPDIVGFKSSIFVDDKSRTEFLNGTISFFTVKLLYCVFCDFICENIVLHCCSFLMFLFLRCYVIPTISVLTSTPFL